MFENPPGARRLDEVAPFVAIGSTVLRTAFASSPRPRPHRLDSVHLPKHSLTTELIPPTSRDALSLNAELRMQPPFDVAVASPSKDAMSPI
ncbi:MAG: hypothetical protein AAFX99_23370 [Myxococcota bacterium]